MLKNTVPGVGVSPLTPPKGGGGSPCGASLCFCESSSSYEIPPLELPIDFRDKVFVCAEGVFFTVVDEYLLPIL